VRAGARLLERGAAAACVKLPDGGCVFVTKEETACISHVPVDVVDTTGAGDAFASALAVAICEGRPHVDAVRFAVAASHLAVTGYGSQPSYPAREGIERMQERLQMRVDQNR
jgi:ribokinase